MRLALMVGLCGWCNGCAGSTSARLYGVGDVAIQIARVGDRLRVVVSWPDATQNVTHRPWVWKNGAYEMSTEREDMAELSFAEGPARPVLSGDARSWDVWHWKAFRTNSAGYAIDKMHYYLTADPGGDAHSYRARSGATVWTTRPEDQGTNVQKRLPKPDQYQGDVVPQYGLDTPSGSVADVRAKGRWEAGRWTVEFSRALSTGHADDVAFVPGRTYALGVTTFDGRGHKEWTPDDVNVIEITVP